jgi:Carboxypeptidase regulatory-like domain
VRWLLALAAVAFLAALWLASRENSRSRADRDDALAPSETTAEAADAADPVSPAFAPEEEGRGEEEGTAYRVTVVSRCDGSPIAGARVLDNKDRCHGATGANGVAEFRGAGDWWYASAPGYFPIDIEFDSEGNGWTELPPAAPVTGRVFDAATGERIAGAEVTLWAADDGLGRDWTKSGEGGRFEVAGALWQGYHLVVEAEGYCRAERRGSITGPLRGLEIGLSAGATLVGHVFDARGLPKEGARIAVKAGEEFVRDTRSDGQGAFRIAGLPLGVELVPWVMEPLHGGPPVTFEHAGEVRDVDIRILPSAILTVALRDADGNAVEVCHAGLMTGEERISQERVEGVWGFDVPPGRYELRVLPYGWPEQRREVVLAAGRRQEEFVLSGGLVVEGTVLAADGSSVSCNVDWRSGSLGGIARTREGGHFRIAGLPAGPVTLYVDDWCHTASERQGIVPGGPPVLIVLEPAGRITGRLVGLAGADDVSTSIWCESCCTSCDSLEEDGRFEFVVSHVGEPIILAFRRNQGAAPVVLALPPLAAGEVRDVGDVPLDAGRDLKGRILGAGDKPLVGALVQPAEPWAWETNPMHCRSDEAGRFCLFRMPKIPFRVRVDAEGYPPHFFLVDGAAELRLTAGGAAEGPGSARLHPASVSDWADNACVHAEPDELGFFRVRLQPGEYEGWVEDKAGASHIVAPFVVQEGKTTRVELTPR